MPPELLGLIDLAFKTLAAIAAIMAIFQLIEVRRKRLIDMYWKIAETYYSDEQREARKNMWLLQSTYFSEKVKANLPKFDMIQAYNKDYHDTTIESNKKIDTSVINRIRFLNQVGVLLRRKLIDRDMLFGLIGAGLEIDYVTMEIVLKAHRGFHKMPYMYIDLENTWQEFNKWKKQRGFSGTTTISPIS